MPELEPSEALTVCERALRQLFERAYSAEFGGGWLNKVAPAERIAAWELRRTDETRVRTDKGAVALPEGDGLLAYAEFHDLLTIAGKHWGPLAAALGKRGTTYPLMRRFQSLRNSVAHSRQLLGFEADLLSGIAGEIRNRVTRYMTDQDPSGDYYARIESVTDSFGRQLAGKTHSPFGAVTMNSIRVRVGDIITFDCVGHDPQDRAVTWTARRDDSELVAHVEGGRAYLKWHLRVDDVGQETAISIKLRNSSSYQRHGFDMHDDAVSFTYEVLPPE